MALVDGDADMDGEAVVDGEVVVDGVVPGSGCPAATMKVTASVADVPSVNVAVEVAV